MPPRKTAAKGPLGYIVALGDLDNEHPENYDGQFVKTTKEAEEKILEFVEDNDYLFSDDESASDSVYCAAIFEDGRIICQNVTVVRTGFQVEVGN